MSASDSVLILLPPSETKRVGGTGAPLDPQSLCMPDLLPQREQVITALVELSADASAAARVLRLGVSQLGEIEANAMLRSAPTMSAIDRYTGVLFDALDASSLDSHARRWLGRHALIHSAPLGPVGALDAIPSYRLGASASMPGLPPLRRVWAAAITEALAGSGASFVLDMRSEAYVALGPVPDSMPHAYVRVVTDAGEGPARALNHFNKHAKGELVRRLAIGRPRVRSLPGLLAWAEAEGIELVVHGANRIDLVIH